MASAPASPSQVNTWEPSSRSIAARYGLRPEQILRFDLNTSPWPAPVLPAALAGPFDPPLSEYPDSWYTDLTAAAAAYVDAAEHEIILGAGADEVLELVAKACLPAGSTALVPVPTYSMYGVFTTHRAARIVAVPRLADDGYRLNTAALIDRLPEVRVVWLCSPNNPTGLPEREADLAAVLDATTAMTDPPLVVVDEAYFEFSGQSVAESRTRHPNMLVVRTMSKAFALSGIRVGFGVGDRSVIERLERVRPPGSVSTISAHIATAALRAPEYAADNARRLSQEREWLAGELARSGWPSAPSICNFLLARIGDVEAAEKAADGLLRAGIVPRPFGPANPLRGHLRLTVRSRPENERLIEVVRGLTA